MSIQAGCNFETDDLTATGAMPRPRFTRERTTRSTWAAARWTAAVVLPAAVLTAGAALIRWSPLAVPAGVLMTTVGCAAMNSGTEMGPVAAYAADRGPAAAASGPSQPRPAGPMIDAAPGMSGRTYAPYRPVAHMAPETPEQRMVRLEAELAAERDKNAKTQELLLKLSDRLQQVETKAASAVVATPGATAHAAPGSITIPAAGAGGMTYTGPAGPVAPGSAVPLVGVPAPGTDERREFFRSIAKEMTADAETRKELAAASGNGLGTSYRDDADFQGSGFLFQTPDGSFSTRLEGRAQARYTYYNQLDKGDVNGVPDRSGNNRDVRSDFGINRLLLDAVGNVFSKNIFYQFQLIGSTNANDAIAINQAYMSWNVFGGNKDVPAFWRDGLQIRLGEYLTSFGRWETNGNAWGRQIPTDFQLIDRPIAVQAFKPDRSTGIELHGMLGGVPEGLPEDRPGTKGFFQYAVGINNGFNAAGKRYGLDQGAARELDKYPSITARGVFDLLKGRYEGRDGKDYYWFGRNQSDLEHHESLALQVGGSMAWQRTRGQTTPADSPGLGFFYRPEPRVNRKPGGGPIPVDEPGSDALRWGADIAAKYKGWSGTLEVYGQNLRGLNNESIRARNQNQDAFGFYASSGYFVQKRTLELVGGVSGIFAGERPKVPGGTAYTNTNGSDVKDNWQFTGGVNWFPYESQKMKVSADVSYLANPALNAPTSGIQQSPDESAWQFRVQVQFGF